jgi:hypothetical protein
MNNSQKMQSELFIVLALIFLLVAVQLIPKNRQTEIDLGKSLDTIKGYESKLDFLKDSILKQSKIIDSLERKANLGVPVFYLSEEEKKFRFSSGSYDLGYSYQIALDKKVKEIDSIASLYPEYNALEIIGHTDGQPIRGDNRYYNNMDKQAADITYEFYYDGTHKSFKAIAGSNVDLGYLRAMSVATYVKKSSKKDSLLQNIKYWFPYSAGSTLRKNGRISTYWEAKGERDINDASRRRIEIRLLKYDK